MYVFSDIGGYVFGKIFKWKKLTKISPNKTIIWKYWWIICVFFMQLSILLPMQFYGQATANIYTHRIN